MGIAFVTGVAVVGGLGTCEKKGNVCRRRRGNGFKGCKLKMSLGSGGDPENKERRYVSEEEEEEGILSKQSIQELDELAEEWIGSNLARWEWYEGVKARRKKMLTIGKENEEKFDKELEELKRTFMEIDAIFGTNMLDEKSRVTGVGWSIVGIIMMGYVVIGYVIFEWIVQIAMAVGVGGWVGGGEWSGFM